MRDGFVPVTTASELSPGTMKWIVIDRERVLIANVAGVYYALRDICGPRGAPLSRGKLAGNEIRVCEAVGSLTAPDAGGIIRGTARAVASSTEEGPP